MTADVHTLLGAYALDALDDIERAAFARHLRECEACRTESDELREVAARLADGAWSVPPPGLRDDVLATIANTRQIAPAGPPPAAAVPVQARTPSRLRLVAAAAVLVAAVGAGTSVYAIQDQRVQRAESLAEAARTSEARVSSILAAPDVVVREQPLTSGGRVTVASSQLRNAGVVMLAAQGAPEAGRVYQLWTIRSGTATSAGVLGTGQSAAVQIVEGLPGASNVGVTVEQAPGAATPTTPLEALVTLT